MGRVTTHILDTALGCPGEGIKINLYRVTDSGRDLISNHVSNSDGRVDGPVLEGDAFTTGIYELDFHAGAYFDAKGIDLPEPKFLDVITLRFGISDAGQHYHVPLLVSPFSYSTYRGS